MYTWGYLKENTLNKLNFGEEQAGELDIISSFPYFANEAMTQICSAIKPKRAYHEIEIEQNNIGIPITMPSDFISFCDEAVRDENNRFVHGVMTYHGYNQVIFERTGKFLVPYNARWFFFTKTLENSVEIPAPADVLDALPSYMASQALRIDDEVRSAIFRNEYEIFLSRIDDSTFSIAPSYFVEGGWTIDGS